MSAPPIEPPLLARILVVDDDLAIGGTIRRYLHGYEIEVADSIEHALEHLGDRSYDLLLLDRRLPDGLCDVVIENVRSRRSSLPIIMMSGEIDPHHVRHAEHSRADDFIEKPFVREALVEKIERLLGAHELRRQAARQHRELAALHAERDREIDVARTIFDHMLARGEFDPAAVRHLVLPASWLPGDVVFGARIGADAYRWMIGDVTGHTLSSALVTLPLSTIFYRAVESPRRPMAEALAIMEHELATMLPANMFCVAAMCELDRRSGVLQVWNGGNPDLLIRRRDGELTRIPAGGMPLAADRFTPPSHPIVEYQVSPGDRIYAFSDGLIELRDASHRMLGLDHLHDIARSGTAQTVFERLLDCIPDRTGATRYDDDISLIEVIV